ncbi:hypothetical protein CL654_01680 [bacterium]|nr:hypothetical protein [bacterium]|tara:strand:- start:16160 stop:16564 length:405 start_codon:yes stop_codon:yes gene_type:complete
MKKIAHISSFLFLVVIAALPLVANAQLPSLIVCGQGDLEPCRVCHLYILADTIIDFLLIIIIPVAALVIAWGGIQYMLAAGNVGSTGKAQSTIKNGVYGIIIAFAAWLIINTIISVLANGSFTNWNQFPNCPGV